jgi:hypothetical protein
LNVLTRNVDIDPFGPATEEKIFSGAKRAGTIIAIAALTVAALDFANIHSVENAAAIFRDNADLPARIRAGIDSISFTSVSPSAQASVPRDGTAIPLARAAAAPAAGAVKPKTSPLAELAAASRQDAIGFAMEPPPSPAAKPNVAGYPLALAALAAEPVDLAGTEFASPQTQIDPTPVSLPMSGAVPLDMVPLPRPSPGVPPPSPAERLHLQGADRVKAERCLANAIYFEARSEPVRGQMAVAQVVVNRAFSGFYPDNICGVVYQNASHHLACQFTFACDGKRKIINERGAWARANRIAKQTLDGKIYVPEVAKSTHYHAVYVHPYWTHEMKKLVRYGIHNFYRPYAWGNGADEPAWGSGVLASNKKK